MMISSLLKTLGLTDKEVKVFAKMVEVGAQPASQIAHLCGMPRNTVRSILDVLVKRGVVVKSRRANTQYYAPENKDNLIRLLKFRKVSMQESIDQQIAMLETYGDELSAGQWAKSRPKITFYEGVSGLEKVYEDTLTAKDGIHSWASTDDMLETMPEYFKTYFIRRAEKNIHMRCILPDTPVALDIHSRDKKELRESALVPAAKFNWRPEIQIYNGKVNITSWKEKLGIIIESEEIAEALKTIFDLSYEAAERYGKTSKAVKGENVS